MLDFDSVPAIKSEELLARYATQSGQFRKDGTVKQDLFMPHPRKELSVTRHLNATESELWAVGRDVSAGMKRKLYGRSDAIADDCSIDGLSVVEKPLRNNANHADVVGWPDSKADKKIIALKIATASKLVAAPTSDV